MNALSVLYGGNLQEVAFENIFSGKNAVSVSLERASSFPYTSKTVLLLKDNTIYKAETPIQVVKSDIWTKKSLLDTLAELADGFDLTYFAWADAPFLDAELAKAIVDRHIRYAAEYSYADGQPYGLAPEIIAPGVAAILSKILKDEDGQVDRETLFSVIQKDINAFDIETVIYPVDLRSHRLSLTADSKRNLLLLKRFADAGFSNANDAQRLITEKPELLRTLPNFYPIQVSGACPQTCTLCPYPQFSKQPPIERNDFLDTAKFDEILDAITEFSDDGVIDISLWGEVSLHPEKTRIIQSVLSRPNLSLIVETSGIGWKTEEIEKLAEEARNALPRKNGFAPLSWIISLDAHDPKRYTEMRGAGYAEAYQNARTFSKLFPKDAYMQAVRVKGAEEDIERFYRSWKDAGANIIIQKHDNFCGYLPEQKAADLSPVRRQSCWHIMRDMPILIDGTVPLCREDIEGLRILGNVFSESLETIWDRGKAFYREHSLAEYTGKCVGCDEYYTYNF